MSQTATIIILLVMLATALFFMMREVFCWYLKINSIESLLKDIKDIFLENKGMQVRTENTDKKEKID